MNAKKVQKSVRALSGWRESAFLLALVERSLPNLILYLESTDSVDLDTNVYPKGFYSLLADSWQAAVMAPNEQSIVECLDQVVSNMIEEDIDSFGVIPCDNCLSLWEMALASGLNRDRKRAAEGSMLSLETVTAFLEFSEGEDLDDNALIKLFEKHDLVSREFSFQEECCDILRSADKLNADLVREIRLLAYDEGISNLGISLEE